MIRHARNRAHRPAALASTSLYAGSSHWRYPAAYHDQDRLPDDDSVYSPTTPMRVHLASDEHIESEKPVSPVFPRPSSFHPQSPRSPTLPSPASTLNSAERDLEAGHDVPDDTRQGINPSVAVVPTAPPPAYGLWRCSVRADPNLLHWVRSPTSAHQSSPLVSPITPLDQVPRAAEAAHNESSPPSYTFVSGSTTSTAPMQAPNEDTTSPLATAMHNVSRQPTLTPAVASRPPEMEEVSPATPVTLGDWILPAHTNAARHVQRESLLPLPPGDAAEVVLEAGDDVAGGASAVHDAARAMLRGDMA